MSVGNAASAEIDPGSPAQFSNLLITAPLSCQRNKNISRFKSMDKSASILSQTHLQIHTSKAVGGIIKFF